MCDALCTNRREGLGCGAMAVSASHVKLGGRSVGVHRLAHAAFNAPKKEFRTRGSALSSAAREGAPTQVSCTRALRWRRIHTVRLQHSLLDSFRRTDWHAHSGTLGVQAPPIRLYVGSAYTGAVLWWIRARTCSCGSGQGTARSRCEGSGRILGRAAATRSATRACIHIGHSAWSTTGSRASRGCMQAYKGSVWDGATRLGADGRNPVNTADRMLGAV